jgi:hypothetical protein
MQDLNREGRRALAKDAKSNNLLILPLETVASFAIGGHGFGYLEKCRRGV